MIIMCPLLSAEVCDHPTVGAYIDAYKVGGEHLQVPLPFKLYLYSKTPPRRQSIPVQRIFLSDLKPHTVYKMEFHRQDLYEQNRWDNLEYFPAKTKVAIEVGFKMDSDYPSMMAWDCETKVAGLTPNGQKDWIISIATYNGTEGKFFHGNSKQVINDFLAYVRIQNPDIICDFNGAWYDVPCLIHNCEYFLIRCALGRNGELPYIETKEYERKGRGRVSNTVRIKSRVHFDVYREVEGDYTLTQAGLKTRGLKEVARHYGYKPVEVDYSKLDQLSFEELRDYNISDAYVTYGVGQIYLKLLWTLADLLNVPLDAIVTRNPSYIPTVVMAREMNKRGIISDSKNRDRFPQFFAEGKKAVQGAEPESFRTGTYISTPEARVRHKDFSSMYVSILRAFNLSPETVKLLNIAPYTGKYHFNVAPDKSYCDVEMPDKINGQVTVRVDLSKKGALREFLDEMVAKRKVSKAKMNEATDPAVKAQYKSEEIALKLVANIMWGYNSMPFADYGNVLIGVFCTAIPRLLLKESMALEESVGNLMLNADTDGYYYVEKCPVSFKASDFIPDCFDVDLITQGIDDVDGMIVLEDIAGDPAAKSYILKEEDGKISFHGSSVLSRSIPHIVDYFVKDLAQTLFDGKNPIDTLKKWNAKHIATYPSKAFEQYITISKRPDEYDETTMYAGLIKQLKNAGINVQRGDKISYLSCQQGFIPTILYNPNIHRICAIRFQERMSSIGSRMTQMPEKSILSYMKGDQLLENWCIKSQS